MSRDISKEHLYESVKMLAEMDETPHLHLNQHKLFTLFSIAFQYMLFRSTKNPGAYIIRIEDSSLAEKLARKSKDASTRRFIQSLLLPRKIKFHGSTFFLDFFHIGSWNMTKDLNPERIKGAIVVKNSNSKPMHDIMTEEDEEDEMAAMIKGLPPHFYLEFLMDVCPKTLFISIDEGIQSCEKVAFPFIKKDKEKTVSGVTLGKDVDWEAIDGDE